MWIIIPLMNEDTEDYYCVNYVVVEVGVERDDRESCKKVRDINIKYSRYFDDTFEAINLIRCAYEASGVEVLNIGVANGWCGPDVY